MKKGVVFGSIAAALALGLVIGALWHWAWLFPFPQLSQWKAHGIQIGQGAEEPPGRWRKTARAPEDQELTEEQRTEIQRLRSIGYLSGSEPAPSQSNVTVYDTSRAYDGLNLIVSGHAPEAILMDMSGKELHKWTCDVFRAWPDFKPKEHFGSEEEELHTFWRRAHLMPNGDLLAIFEGIGILKLDVHSNLIWSIQNGAHHDLYVARNGHIYVLTRDAHIKATFNAEKPILEDFITVLDPDGKELRKVSVLECLENSPYATILGRLEAFGDILHTNTIELIEDDRPHELRAFNHGMILISILRLDLVCVVDLEEETVVWAESDMWRHQHQPTMLENGNILVFNNKETKSTSAVIEFDPVSRETRWCYSGKDDNPFYSETCGSCQRLPNGNTLITESDPGRVFEVTPAKEIVWEYVNPYRAGENDELIASLLEVVRLELGFAVDFLP